MDPFTTKVIQHSKKLEGFALKLLKNSDDAKDLLQDTLLKAFRSRNTYSEKDNMNAWLHQIMFNNYINTYRAGKRETTRLGIKVDLEEAFKAQLLLTHHTPETLFNSRQAYQEIYKVLRTLPPEFKDAVKLRQHDELDYATIGRKLGCPEQTVKSKIHRGRILARAKLLKYARAYGLQKGK